MLKPCLRRTELLLEKGYEVHGIIRRSSSFNTSRLHHLYQDQHERMSPDHAHLQRNRSRTLTPTDPLSFFLFRPEQAEASPW